MLFNKILVALDGSVCSQIATEYAFSLARDLSSVIDGQHVLDPRMVNMFVAREFAEELGFKQSVETTEKVFTALKRIAVVILDLFEKEAKKRGFKPQTFLDVGYIVEEIVKRLQAYDLLVMGHCRDEHKPAAELITGSVAERVASESKKPVLIAVKPLDSIKSVLVGYDGSEPAKGALLMAEQLAARMSKPLKALMVAADSGRLSEANLTVEQGADYLRAMHDEEVFAIRQGPAADTLIKYADEIDALLVVGSYGYNLQEKLTLGSTATYVVRKSKSSLLVYK